MNVRVDLTTPIYDGLEVVFKAPCNAANVTGLNIYYPVDGVQVSQNFAFADANANDVGDLDNLFAEGAVVKVILDTDANKAFIQNADTNAYLEGRFNKNNQLKVIIEGDFTKGEATTSHTGQEIYEHIQNGGGVIAYLVQYGEYIALNCSEPSIAYFHELGSGSLVYNIEIFNDEVTYRLIENAKQSDMTELTNRVKILGDNAGDISAALDAIIAIQNELIGRDVV